MSNYQKKFWKRGESGMTPILAEDLNKYEDYLFMHDQQIENLTHIPEGSTTADLEVIDGRVGYDGEIFNSLGDAIRGQIEDVYDRMGHPIYPKGTISFENLPNFDVVTVGDMYNISNDFTTDSRFAEGSGKKISAGANVYAIDTNGTMQWDLFAPVNNIVIDSAISDTSENPVQNKVVKSALDNLSSLTLKPQGNIVFANLPNNPETYDMYKVTDDFTTDNRFEESNKEVKAPIFIYFNGTKWVLFASSGGDTHIIGTRNQCISWARQGMIPDGSVCIFTDDYATSTPYVVGTQAQINQMLSQGLLGDGTVCVVTDDYTEELNLAQNIGYDNTSSGLSSTRVQGAIDEINSDLTPSSTKYISATYSDQYFESSCVKVGKLVVCSVLTKCSNTLNDTIVLYGRLPYAVKELLEFGWTPLAQNLSFSATSFVTSNSKDINLQINGVYNADTYMRANFVYVTSE